MKMAAYSTYSKFNSLIPRAVAVAALAVVGAALVEGAVAGVVATVGGTVGRAAVSAVSASVSAVVAASVIAVAGRRVSCVQRKFRNLSRHLKLKVK